jgi:hypothetical protein
VPNALFPPLAPALALLPVALVVWVFPPVAVVSLSLVVPLGVFSEEPSVDGEELEQPSATAPTMSNPPLIRLSE